MVKEPCHQTYGQHSTFYASVVSEATSAKERYDVMFSRYTDRCGCTHWGSFPHSDTSPPPNVQRLNIQHPLAPPRRNRLTLFQCPQRPNPKLSGHSQVERGLHLYAAHKYIFIIFWKFVLFGEYAVNPWPERMPQVRPSGTRKRAAAAARVPRICLH